MSPQSSRTQHDPDAWRDRFPILESSTYLVNHSLGAMPRAVFGKLQGFAEQWATRGVRSWAEGWWDAPVEVGNLVGRIMNAPENTVVMHQNVSIVQSIVASALDFSGERNKVVYTELNFPTCMYVWEAMKKRGARIHEVKSDDGATISTERMLEAIDEETLIVPISHVFYKSSYQQDAAAICARAREVGALVLLDCYQSLGTVPIDVQALGVDMICGGSVKWLCGDPGAAYLYVRPGLIERLQPSITGWMAHADPFAFETGEQRYADGSWRMLHGSPAVAALVGATAGHETILEVGTDVIRDYSVHMTEGLRANMLERGFDIPSPADPARRGGTLTIAVSDDEDGPAFVQALEQRNILVDHRPGCGIRVSPHFYTRESELEEFAETMSELRATGAWKPFVDSTAVY